MAGELPGGEFAGGGGLDLREGGLVGDEEGDDLVFFTARGVEDEALAHGGVLEKDAFDFFGSDFAAGDLDEVGGAAEDEEFAVANFDEVAAAEGAAREGVLGFGPVGFGDGGAADFEHGVSDVEGNVLHGLADERGVFAREI